MGGGGGNSLGLKHGYSLGCMLLECSGRIRAASKVMQMAKIWKILDIKDGNIIPFGVFFNFFFLLLKIRGEIDSSKISVQSDNVHSSYKIFRDCAPH